MATGGGNSLDLTSSDQLSSGNSGDFGNNWGSMNKTVDMRGGFMGDTPLNMPLVIVAGAVLVGLYIWRSK